MAKFLSPLVVLLCMSLIANTLAQYDDEKSLPHRIVEEIGKCNLLFEDKDKEICPEDITGRCMNEKALYYTNILRACKRRHTGNNEIQPLLPGSMAMLKNAMQHTKTQAAKENIFHQDIATVKFGPPDCRDDLSGENVAMHWKPFFAKNPAWYCVMNQWLRSDGHRENMLRPEFKTGVIGIIQGKDGRQTCTQTFLSHKPKLGSGPDCVSSSINEADQSEAKIPHANVPKAPSKSKEETQHGSEKNEKVLEKQGNFQLQTLGDSPDVPMNTPSKGDSISVQQDGTQNPLPAKKPAKYGSEYVIRTKSGKKISFVEVIHKDICIKETLKSNHNHRPLCFGPYFSKILKEYFSNGLS